MSSPLDPGASHDRLAAGAVSWPAARSSAWAVRAATPDDGATTWVFRRLPEVTEWMTAAPETLAEYAARFTAPGHGWARRWSIRARRSRSSAT